MTEMLPWALTAAALVIFGGAALAKLANERRVHYEKWTEKFYTSIRPLISDDQTPVEVLSLLRFLNEEITNKNAAREVVWVIGRTRTAEPSNGVLKTRDAVEIFAEARPELGKKFHEACAAALFSVSYNSLFYGWVLRKFTLFGEVDQNSKRAENLAKKLRNEIDSNGHCGGNFATA